MTPAEQVLAKLEGVRRVGSGWQARCPSHDDQRPSLSLRETDDGRLLLKCHAGCELGSILTRLSLSERDLFAQRDHGTGGRITATYEYVDETDSPLFEVVRFDPKAFRQRRRDGDGNWVWNLGNTRRVLYRLPRVIAAAKARRVIWIVEGERDVDTLERLGLVATSNPHGAGKWRPEYAETLRGCKGVAILPDNDEPGRKHAIDVARSLDAIGIPVKVVPLPGLAAKGDASEWIAAGGTIDKLVELVKAAPRWVPTAEGLAVAAAEPDGVEGAVLRCVADVVPERVEWLWQHRIPLGKVTVLDGDPGLGKSMLTLDLAARVSRGTAMPDGKESRDPAGVVLLSAEDGIGDTIRPRLEAAGADIARVHVLTAVRDADGKPRPPSIPHDVAAIRTAAREKGARLIVIDPLMAFLSGRVNSHRDQDVRRALHLVAELADVTGAAVVIVRHLNKTLGAHPVYRGGGSIGIIGAARAGLLVALDPKDETRRVLAVTKSNLGPIPLSLVYRVVHLDDTSVVSWEGESAASARDLLATFAEGGNDAPRHDAEAFLRILLADGPLPSNDVRREAESAGLSWATVRRAQASLGVRATKQGGQFGGDSRWYWELSPRAAEDAQQTLKALTQNSEHLQPEVSTSRTDLAEVTDEVEL